MDLLDGKIGSVGAYELDLVAGKLVVKVNVAAPEGVGSVALVLELDGCAVLDVVAKAIPGTIDDALIGVAKAALKAANPAPVA